MRNTTRTQHTHNIHATCAHIRHILYIIIIYLYVILKHTNIDLTGGGLPLSAYRVGGGGQGRSRVTSHRGFYNITSAAPFIFPNFFFHYLCIRIFYFFRDVSRW